VINRNEWPEDGLEYLASCPVCGGTQRNILFEGLVDKVFDCAAGKWTLWKCMGCQNAYLDPRPTSASIHLAYAVYYTHDEDAYVPYDSLCFLRKLRRRFANGYRNWRYGSNFQPQSIFGIPLTILLPQIRKSFVHKHRFLPKLPRDARILDVGFGTGHFMDMAIAAGWKPAGVDSDSVVVEKARSRGHDVSLGGIEVYAGQQDVFDAITMSHVIEHVHKPVRALEIAYELLKPGGYIMVDTPNLDSMGLEFFGSNWRGLEVPRHLVIFSWDSMNILLNDIGFVGAIECPRHDVSLGMFEKSKAISEGFLPHNATLLPTLSEWEIRQASASTSNLKRSEFVTLVARKPA